MSHIYDSWERLVAAVLRRDELWRLFHEDSRSPSIRSEASSSSFSSSNYSDVAFGYTVPYQKPNLIFVSDNTPDFEFEDLVGASAEFLGKGTFGNAYTAVTDNGIKIFVKELKSVNMSETEFKRSMEIIGSVKHEHVVPLKAYLYSKDEKLMLYNYYSNGSVSALLHGRKGENRASLDWEARLRIATGAARGIAYIHSQRVMKLVHGNIKSSSIFLDWQQYGCISDFGLAGMMSTEFKQTERHHAPEVKNSQDVSQASDVYSFGILILELLTRNSPVPTSHDKAIDLASWVNSFKRKEWVAKVLDVDLIMNNSNIKDNLIKLLQIGIRCVEKAPKKRPKMSSIVKMIEDIRLKSTGNGVPMSVNTKTLVFLNGRNHGFDLEDMLGSSAEVLGKGTFGSTYKVRLQGGVVLTVKRLRDVVAMSKEFQKHMEIIGRIRHDNVAQLMAYYYSTDEKLLVYDFFDEGNVSAMLHGDNDNFLNWEAILRIAVGAARGIAHIHKQDNHRLVHGNIKSSNIFVNERKFGCVADAGLGAVVRSVASPRLTSASAMGELTPHFIMTVGYRAPEVIDTKKVTQESDVYSFGVLLLELVSGKPPLLTKRVEKTVTLVEWFESVGREEWTSEVYNADLSRRGKHQVAISQVLHLALDCVASVPEHRPKMAEVAKMLEEISGIDAEEDVPNVTRLEDLLPKLMLSMETTEL